MKERYSMETYANLGKLVIDDMPCEMFEKFAELVTGKEAADIDEAEENIMVFAAKNRYYF